MFCTPSLLEAIAFEEMTRRGSKSEGEGRENNDVAGIWYDIPNCEQEGSFEIRQGSARKTVASSSTATGNGNERRRTQDILGIQTGHGLGDREVGRRRSGVEGLSESRC